MLRLAGEARMQPGGAALFSVTFSRPLSRTKDRPAARRRAIVILNFGTDAAIVSWENRVSGVGSALLRLSRQVNHAALVPLFFDHCDCQFSILGRPAAPTTPCSCCTRRSAAMRSGSSLAAACRRPEQPYSHMTPSASPLCTREPAIAPGGFPAARYRVHCAPPSFRCRCHVCHRRTARYSRQRRCSPSTCSSSGCPPPGIARPAAAPYRALRACR